MLTLNADQIRLLLTLTEDDWWTCENEKGYADQRLTGRQILLEGIQERLKEALEVAV